MLAEGSHLSLYLGINQYPSMYACLQDAAPCSGKLLESINRDFGSLEELKTKMSADSAAVQVCCAQLRRPWG